MPQQVLGSIVVGLSANTTAFTTSLDKAADTADKAGKKVSGAFKNFSSRGVRKGTGEMEDAFSQLEARHAAHMLGMNRAVGSYLSHLHLIGPALALAFTPLAMIEVGEYLGKGIEKIKEWSEASEKRREGEVKLATTFAETSHSIQKELDAQEEKYIRITKGPIAAMEFGLQHMDSFAVKALKDITKELEEMEKHLLVDASWLDKLFNWGSAATAKSVHDLGIQLQQNRLDVTNPQTNSDAGMGSFYRGKGALSTLNLADVNRDLNSARANLEALQKPNEASPSLTVGTTKEIEAEKTRIFGLQQLQQQIRSTQQADEAAQKAGEAGVKEAQAKKSETSAMARIKGVEHLGEQQAAAERSIAEDLFRNQETALKNQLALAVENGADRTRVALSLIPTQVANQKRLNESLLVADEDGYKARKTALQAEAAELAKTNVGGSNDAALITNRAAQQALEAKHAEDQRHIREEGQRAITALESQGALDRTVILRKELSDRLFALSEGVKQQVEKAREGASEQASKARDEAQKTIAEVNNQQHAGLMTWNAAKAAKISALRDEQVELDRILTQETASIQKQMARLKEQMSQLSPDDPRLRELQRQYDDLANSIDKLGSEHGKSSSKIKTQIEEITKSTDKANLTWGEYIKKMEVDASNTGQKLNNEFQRAFEGLNDNLSKVLTGQKVSWESFFRSIAASLMKVGLKTAEGGLLNLLEGTGVGSLLGALFGGGGGGAPPGGPPAPPAQTMGYASGGDLDPYNINVVGEQGPEVFTPGVHGNVTSNADLRKKLGGGGPSIGYLDARGTNPAEVEMRVKRGMTMAYNAALRDAARAQQERQARSPASTYGRGSA